MLCTVQGEEFNNYKPEEFLFSARECECVPVNSDNNWVLIETPPTQTNQFKGKKKNHDQISGVTAQTFVNKQVRSVEKYINNICLFKMNVYIKM